MNLYLDRIPGLSNTNVVTATSLDAVVRKGYLVEQCYGVYILEEGDVVYTKPSNSETYMANLCSAEGCIDSRWTLVDISSEALRSIPTLPMSEDEKDHSFTIHCIAKSSLMDDILTTTVLEDINYDLTCVSYELYQAHRNNGTHLELINEVNVVEGYTDINKPVIKINLCQYEVSEPTKKQNTCKFDGSCPFKDTDICRRPPEVITGEIITAADGVSGVDSISNIVDIIQEVIHKGLSVHISESYDAEGWSVSFWPGVTEGTIKMSIDGTLPDLLANLVIKYTENKYT